ncbi:hypothetical protein GCK32_016238 [Trichostrongylus colubriformis]|uniref:Methyltransferase FkbM domain-containing protein n=1 Tax=Trichostrongylus colubriformis TaxID=6319 RepID=A0AAN8ICY4_TRICO
MRLTVARGVICVLAAVLIFLIVLRATNRHSATPTRVLQAFIDWQLCMTARFDSEKQNPEKLWAGFAEMTEHCTSNTDVSKIKLIELPNEDEVKHYIMSEDSTDPSVVVSLGIGADIKVEQQLKKLLPQDSEFFGADPVVIPNAELYAQVGMFFPVAVSEHSGPSKAHIRMDNGEYKYVPVIHLDVQTFFTKMINRTHIDHLILDNEGPEYQLIPMIAIDNVFADEKIAICHMNVEFHAPGPKTRYDDFVEVMQGVLRAGRFAAIHNENFGHQRMFLVNYEDPYCVHKYLEQFF